MPIPFRIKVCGLTSREQMVSVVEAGADALGLNYYEKSKRFVGEWKLPPLGELEDIGQQAITLVGLFVNHPVEVVNYTAARVGLRWVQLHGDEPPEYLPLLDPSLKIMRAYRTDNWERVLADLDACRSCGRNPDAILLDANVLGHYGGTGETADWQAFADRDREQQLPPLILAGGLTPENVAEAIRVVQPDGVDVASGVESTPGIKDIERVKQFVSAAKSALHPA
ncbi:phosphoribosylanthranilate isomerase [Aeoliella mucimassa]|uniref:N-(5'-phosphoribosyl)anthranilate isomerase n=1 Tax=Aeoliella mucimassa TaxID=2527972 RepID=A0A518AUA6_9BACT|nr:phosphoribosylanthranilate isomerase [Aeoliella mucimassa]QDU58307.1 N-(5'-phosphoribosyl)anthranilate isomerase [Aeoliella mucimassa]